MSSTKSDLAYKTMKKLIVTKKWLPGQKFSVLEISKKLNISRSPVSEAVKLLASEGYVKIIPHKGFEISSYSTKELEETLEIKMALEGLAAYKAAENKSRNEKEILSEILALQKDSLDNNDVESARKYDQELHFHIFKLSESPKLEKMVTTLWNHGNYYSDLFTNEEELSEIYQEHKELVEAIIDSKPEEARKISEKHNKRYINNMLSKIEELHGNGNEDQDTLIDELLYPDLGGQIPSQKY